MLAVRIIVFSRTAMRSLPLVQTNFISSANLFSTSVFASLPESFPKFGMLERIGLLSNFINETSHGVTEL